MSYLFDPDLNLYLQSFRSLWLTALMLAVSAVGSKEFLVFAAFFILSTVDFRKGALILQMLLWSFVLTGFLKELFGLPRPTDLEPSLSSFEGFFPNWIIEYVHPEQSPGFPSGHVISTVTFWISVIYLFPGQKFQKLTAIALIILMPVSRIYLGRHFLGDVLGGLLVGAAIPILGFFLLNHFGLRRAFLMNKEWIEIKIHLAVCLFVYLLVLPMVLNLIPLFSPKETGLWFGVNFFFFWMILRRLPLQKGLIPTGWERFLMVVFFYIGITWILSVIEFPSGNRWIEFTVAAAPPSLSLLVTDSVFSAHIV
ncbi:MAG TPA: phosphatase PAP2 family protein [Acidobacteriota bacterium]|nr:phosphatase PAP2 family protein [Acidobacteriota bacterium]